MIVSTVVPHSCTETCQDVDLLDAAKVMAVYYRLETDLTIATACYLAQHDLDVYSLSLIHI